MLQIATGCLCSVESYKSPPNIETSCWVSHVIGRQAMLPCKTGCLYSTSSITFAGITSAGDRQPWHFCWPCWHFMMYHTGTNVYMKCPLLHQQAYNHARTMSLFTAECSVPARLFIQRSLPQVELVEPEQRLLYSSQLTLVTRMLHGTNIHTCILKG